MTSTLRHLAKLQRKYGITVDVAHGNVVASLIAVPAKSTAKVVGLDGSFTEYTIDDWIVAVADWPRGWSSPPQKGDLLKLQTGTGVVNYIVTHPDQNTPVFSNFNQLDRPALAWRIHTINE